MTVTTDFLVLGSGVAGLTFALGAAELGEVTIITKRAVEESNTRYAQGGIAAVLGKDDTPEAHVRDTLIAGGGLCHEVVVEICAREGPERIREHSHHTKQHGSAVRSEHEFYAEVCERMAGIAEVLVTGSHQAQADFRHYLSKHRPALKSQVAGYETVAKPSDAQLVAVAREFFVRFDRMNGVPTPS